MNHSRIIRTTSFFFGENNGFRHNVHTRLYPLRYCFPILPLAFRVLLDWISSSHSRSSEGSFPGRVFFPALNDGIRFGLSRPVHWRSSRFSNDSSYRCTTISDSSPIVYLLFSARPSQWLFFISKHFSRDFLLDTIDETYLFLVSFSNQPSLCAVSDTTSIIVALSSITSRKFITCTYGIKQTNRHSKNYFRYCRVVRWIFYYRVHTYTDSAIRFFRKVNRAVGRVRLFETVIGCVVNVHR